MISENTQVEECTCGHCGHLFEAKPEPKHLLIVGDCTDAGVVARVMGGERAALCLSSPPYPGADMWNADGEDMHEAIDRLSALNRNALMLVFANLENGGVCCWNVQDVPFGNQGQITTTTTTTTTTAVKEIGFTIRGCLIWDKGIPHLPAPWNMRRPCVPNVTHESILVLFKGAWVPREKTSGLSDEGKTWLATGVWKIATESAKAIGHKAPFPLNLAIRPVELFSLENDLVFEPFSGSGTTLIACERLGRRCRAVEIEPGYVAVALERWHVMTGRTPELLP